MTCLIFYDSPPSELNLNSWLQLRILNKLPNLLFLVISQKPSTHARYRRFYFSFLSLAFFLSFVYHQNIFFTIFFTIFLNFAGRKIAFKQIYSLSLIKIKSFVKCRRFSWGAAWHKEIWYEADDVKLQSQLMIHSLCRDDIIRFS